MSNTESKNKNYCGQCETHTTEERCLVCNKTLLADIEFVNEMAKEHFTDTKKKAEEMGMLVNFENQMNVLRSIAYNNKSKVILSKDSAPFSFNFFIPGMYNGGLIFHGSHDGFGSGSAPTFSVTMNATRGWSIHT